MVPPILILLFKIHITVLLFAETINQESKLPLPIQNNLSKAAKSARKQTVLLTKRANRKGLKGVCSKGGSGTYLKKLAAGAVGTRAKSSGFPSKSCIRHLYVLSPFWTLQIWYKGLLKVLISKSSERKPTLWSSQNILNSLVSLELRRKVKGMLIEESWCTFNQRSHWQKLQIKPKPSEPLINLEPLVQNWWNWFTVNNG